MKTAFVFVAYYEKVAAIISLNEFLNKYFNRKFAVFLGPRPFLNKQEVQGLHCSGQLALLNNISVVFLIPIHGFKTHFQSQIKYDRNVIHLKREIQFLYEASEIN